MFSDPCGGWAGVTCDSNRPSGVVRLALPGASIFADLFGVLPGLAQLYTLQALDLSANSLYSSIPSRIAQLSSLTSLMLGERLSGRTRV